MLASSTEESAPDHLDLTLAALANSQRRRVVDLLGQQPRPAGELALELGVSPSVLSRHLRVLRKNGVVEEAHPEFDARVRIYSLRSGAMNDLKAWLAAVERGWSEELTALKRHVERPS